MKTPDSHSAHALRNELLRKIWSMARALDTDPRQLVPLREGVTGEKGSALSVCTLEELQQIGFALKRAGGRRWAKVWIPAIPSDMRRLPTPWQLDQIKALLDRQTYLADPDRFFHERLGVRDPNGPTFSEAKKMISYLISKDRSERLHAS